MAEKKNPSTKSEKLTDKIVEKVYKDSDSYDWSGKQVDSGAQTRRKGSDGP
jgi:hypothetical protein